MIQRIQTVYLFLAFVLMMGLFIFPIYITNQGADEFYVDEHTILAGLTLAVSLVSLGDIFLYKNRPLQMNLVWLGVVLDLAFIGLSSYYYYQDVLEESVAEISFDVGVALPIIVLILLFMAYNGIRKDEKLVRSLDRLR